MNIDVKTVNVETSCDTNNLGTQTGPRFMDVDVNKPIRS